MTNTIKVGCKEIFELSDKEAKNYKCLGRAVGYGIGLCLYQAHKHCQDFANRVVAYRIIENDNVASVVTEKLEKQYIAVEFYE